MYLEVVIQVDFHVHQALQMEELKVFEVAIQNDQWFQKFILKIVEDMTPDSLHRVKQGTSLSLNTQLGPPRNNVPLTVNCSKEAILSSKLFLNRSC